MRKSCFFEIVEIEEKAGVKNCETAAIGHIDAELFPAGSALHESVTRQDEKNVELLLSLKADPNKKSKKTGLTPLMIAAFHLNLPLTILLLNFKADPTAISNKLTGITDLIKTKSVDAKDDADAIIVKLRNPCPMLTVISCVVLSMENDLNFTKSKSLIFFLFINHGWVSHADIEWANKLSNKKPLHKFLIEQRNTCSNLERMELTVKDVVRSWRSLS